MAEWTTDQIKARIRGEAIKQDVDPDLALAIATQESYLNPNAKGDRGKSLGLFQLQPAAAIDVGVNPQWRHEPGVNIYGGIAYIKQKLLQSKGNVDEALRRYNGGGDPNYVQNVMRFFKPGVAEAAERPQAGTYTDADVQEALKALQTAQAPSQPQGGTYGEEDIQNALKALGGPQTPVTPPSPPTARSTPEQDAAYRAWAARQPAGDTQPPPPASQTTPQPVVQPAASQVAQTPRLSMGDPREAATEPEARATIEAMRASPAGARGLAPPPDLAPLAGGGGPTQQAPTVTDPAALLAGGRMAQAPSATPAQLQEQARARQVAQGTPSVPLPPGVPSVEQETLQEGITAPSTMIPLLMPGAGLKLVPGALKTAAPFLNRAVRPVAEGLSQTAGWTAGRTVETGEVPSPAEIGKEAALNVAVGGVVEIPAALRAAKNAALRATPGAQILLNQRAVQEAEGLGKRVFNAQDKAVVGKAFDSVAATGEKLDVTPVRDLWNSLTLAERRIAGNELNKISSTFADALKTRKLGDWDIGELQHLRSELRTASLSKRTPETQDLLQSLRTSVDEAIANGMAKGSLPATELIEAQKAYRKVMQAEDLQGLITKHTRDSPNLKWQELNLAALNKELRGGGTKAARNLTKGMDATEKQLLMQELDSLKRHYPFVQIPRQGATMAGTSAALAATGLALTGNLPAAAAVAVPAILAAASRSPNVMSLFKRSIIEGKGRLAQHHVDALLNAIRHEND